MESTRQRLMLLKEQAEQATQKANKLEGALEALQAEMKKKYKVSTRKEAKALLQKLEEDLAKQNSLLVAEVEAIEEQMSLWTP